MQSRNLALYGSEDMIFWGSTHTNDPPVMFTEDAPAGPP